MISVGYVVHGLTSPTIAFPNHYFNSSIAIHLRYTYTNINTLSKPLPKQKIHTTEPRNTAHIDHHHVQESRSSSACSGRKVLATAARPSIVSPIRTAAPAVSAVGRRQYHEKDKCPILFVREVDVVAIKAFHDNHLVIAPPFPTYIRTRTLS